MPTQQERNRAYYEANREQEQARSLSYYHKNKHSRDPQKKRAYMAEYLKTYKRKPKTSEQVAERNRRRRERYAKDPEYREKNRQHAKTWSQDNPEKKANQRLKAAFGITLDQFNKMLAQQNGGCAICGTTILTKTKSRHYVDHNHKTGKVRGILCHHCNFGIGHFQDNPNLLTKAADYLKRTG